MSVVIRLDSREATLKRRLRHHMRALGFTKSDDGSLQLIDTSKDTYRALHRVQRMSKVRDSTDFLAKNAMLSIFFASGEDVQPEAIRPRLELIETGSWQSDLFRLATLYWRVPVSGGYGRRLRFLVWDDHAAKLMGVIGLGDAVFNLGVRDRFVGWDHQERAQRLVSVMDAFVLGAIPPYNKLLGGKLIACLIRTKEVVNAFRQRYGDSTGIISGQKKSADLALVTTSSALGRSSVYNRLSLAGNKYFEPIGYTLGWGHFHVPDDVFAEMRALLARRDDPYADGHRFGDGPNWRMRAIRKAMEVIGMSPRMIKHGLRREVFSCCVAGNALSYLRGEHPRADYRDLLSVEEVSALGLRRWVVPRAARQDDYRTWKVADLFSEMLEDEPVAPSVDVRRA